MNFLKIILKCLKMLFLAIMILVLLASVSALGVLYCYPEIYPLKIFSTKEERFFYKTLKKFESSGKESMPLKELTNFEWDEACFKSTYDPRKQDSYGKFYLHGKLVEKIIARSIKLDGDEEESYFGFNCYVGTVMASKNKSTNCETYESYCSPEVNLSLELDETPPDSMGGCGDYLDCLKEYYILFSY